MHISECNFPNGPHTLALKWPEGQLCSNHNVPWTLKISCWSMQACSSLHFPSLYFPTAIYDSHNSTETNIDPHPQCVDSHQKWHDDGTENDRFFHPLQSLYRRWLRFGRDSRHVFSSRRSQLRKTIDGSRRTPSPDTHSAGGMETRRIPESTWI